MKIIIILLLAIGFELACLNKTYAFTGAEGAAVVIMHQAFSLNEMHHHVDGYAQCKQNFWNQFVRANKKCHGKLVVGGRDGNIELNCQK